MDVVPTWAFLLAAAVVGLELGGVATLFIQRWIDEQPICTPGRSCCPSCGHNLSWGDTIPLLSYLLLRGRCRYCGVPIGMQYVLVEVSCMAWSLAVAHGFGLSAEWAVYLVLGVMLIAGSFIDLETSLLPDRITLGGTAIALAASFFLSEGPTWQQAFFGAAAGGGLFFAVERYYTWRGRFGVGLGDVKLMCMVGALTGLRGLPVTVLLIGVISYAVLGVMALRGGRKVFSQKFPYGPFISLGCMVYILYGQSLVRWFSNL